MDSYYQWDLHFLSAFLFLLQVSSDMYKVPSMKTNLKILHLLTIALGLHLVGGLFVYEFLHHGIDLPQIREHLPRRLTLEV